MREIKFRAWDKKKKQFYKKSVIAVSPDGVLRHIREFDQWVDTSFIPLQYTGLKDKNGKEIYEGDIVHSDLLAITAPVKFENGGFGFHGMRADLKPTAIHGALASEFEIIGNIYENPELLEP